MTFPDGFWFGAGASSTVAEGAAPASELAAWEAEGRRTPSGAGTGFADAYVDDLPLFAAHGLAHLRVTLEWARLEPTPGHHDSEAVEHLRLVLQAARSAGVSVWGCLFDASLPGWFAHDERGFADARSRQYYWARHVEFVGETFGDLVHGWMPIFEPTRYAVRGWIDGSRPPGRRDDAEAFATIVEAVHLASVDAALRLRQDGQPVAAAQWLAPVFPAKPAPDAPAGAEAEVAAGVVDEVLWGCWRRMLTEETLVVPGRPPVSIPGARTAFDVLGLTYRHAIAVRGDGVLLPYPQHTDLGPDGQVPWAEGLGLALHHVAESLPDHPLLIAGYGRAFADPTDQAEHLRDGLAIAEEAVEGGIDLRGFWWETPVDPPPMTAPDPAEGGDGPGAGPGLFAADRTPRPSADLLASIAAGDPLPS
ncbi:hypothetical protein BH10ACT1_BH10ACT1_32880 [soil metagenome]